VAFLTSFSEGFGQTPAQGNIVTFIETIRNAMPDAGSNGFVIPQASDLTAFQTGFTNLISKNYSALVLQVASYGYMVYKYADSGSSDTLYVLTENLPVQRGWGTYIFNPSGTNNIMIECPHPIYDTRSWRLAIEAFLRLDTKWFSMAGTHRYANTDQSSDMAHVTQSVFYKAHTTIAAPIAIQIHGFAKSSHPGYPDVVISNGTLYPPTILSSLKAKYEEQSFTAGVFSLSTQLSLGDLGATTNKQGQWSNSNGKTFVHIEHDTPLRTDDAKLGKAVEALYNTFTPPLSVAAEPLEHLSDFRLDQNYPNPFNPTTRIRFTVPKSGRAKVTVYNTLGQTVGVLWDNEAQVGQYYDLIFDAKGLSTSMYLVRLEHNGASIMQKIIFLK